MANKALMKSRIFLPWFLNRLRIIPFRWIRWSCMRGSLRNKLVHTSTLVRTHSNLFHRYILTIRPSGLVESRWFITRYPPSCGAIDLDRHRHSAFSTSMASYTYDIICPYPTYIINIIIIWYQTQALVPPRVVFFWEDVMRWFRMEFLFVVQVEGYFVVFIYGIFIPNCVRSLVILIVTPAFA